MIVEARRRGAPIDPATARWLAEASPELRASLEGHGLVQSAGARTVDELCQYCIERAAGLSPAGRQKIVDTAENLRAYFGHQRPLAAITPGDGDDFGRWLAHSGRRPKPGPLAPTTVAKRVQQARSFFGAAVRKRWVAENPLAGVVAHEAPSGDRQYYVTVEMARAMLEQADPELGLLIALARWGGLRIPSEAYPLEWGWLNEDPQEGSLRVYSPKNARYPHKAWRFVPLFPELRGPLAEARERAGDGERFIVRTRPGQVTDTALRNRLERCCLRAGILPYPKLWQNLRSTRETELVAAGMPIHVVCAWLNNSPKVAMRHYLQIPADFVRQANALGLDAPQSASAAAP